MIVDAGTTLRKEYQMRKNTAKILEALDQYYGTEYRCSLDHENAWQLLIATMLSAQCTDARVNIVTKDLFQKYKSVEDFAKADLKELEQDIHSTGFYHNKAKNIIACCRQLLERHNGEVPSSIEELTALAGVGRKTANVIRGNIFHEPSIVVDTHVKRISKKLGVSKSDDPVKAEMELMKELPKDHWILWNIHIRVSRSCSASVDKEQNSIFLRIAPLVKYIGDGVIYINQTSDCAD